jgi:hypothetical protein
MHVYVLRMRSVEISAGTSTNPSDVSLSFPQNAHANACIIPRVVHYPFLPNTFQFIVHPSSYHSTSWSPRYLQHQTVNKKKIDLIYFLIAVSVLKYCKTNIKRPSLLSEGTEFISWITTSMGRKPPFIVEIKKSWNYSSAPHRLCSVVFN